ncbi:MAG: hypothetical protein MUF61_00090 [archaeon]|jgi:hypothetical protein|nr:hypothetical protein [archaeon]
MKKGRLFAVYIIAVLAAILLSMGSVSAAANDSMDTSAKAYKCLEDQISTKGASALSLQEAVFSMLALGSKSGLSDKIESEKGASCWPKSGCTIRDSAQVLLAYQRAGKGTGEIEKWLETKNATPTELKWLLEIDITNGVSANCTINDGTKENKIKILDTMRLQGSPGSCMVIDPSGFMLRINSNCMGTQFTISCDADFVTTMLYQRGTGGTVFVPSETHSAAASGTTTERPNAKCFKTASTCDYEGTLWAALALQKLGKDVSEYMPYLLALAPDNPRYFPETFLYILGGGEEQYSSIVQNQKQGKYWEQAGTPYGKFYDTALALMSLSGKSSAEYDNAKNYLSSVQTKDGCWNNNNIKDTAFLLYGGWQKSASTEAKAAPSCTGSGFSCENLYDCVNANGTVQYGYECLGAGLSCCSVKVAQQTCTQKGGMVCTIEQTCDGRLESASDGSCCLGGACIAAVSPITETCGGAGGICKDSCESNEEYLSVETCGQATQICCRTKAGSLMWLWIILLIILIALVVLGIIYRDKVKIWWFKFKEKFKKKPAQPPAGGLPAARILPPGMARPPMVGAPRPPMGYPMRPMPAPARAVPPRQPTAKDREMEETLKKIKEIGKK